MGASTRVVGRVVGTVVLVLGLLSGGAAAASDDRRGTITSSAPYLMPVEPYAGYQPQTRCRRTPKEGIAANPS